MFYFCKENSPSWVDIEAYSLQIPLNLYLYSASLKQLRPHTTHPIVLNMVNIWYEVRKYMTISNSLSQFSPIWGNTGFKPGTLDAGFQIWAKKGLRKISDLYKEGVLMTFEDISLRFNIPRKHFFKYLQLRSFISSSQNQSLTIPTIALWKKL